MSSNFTIVYWNGIQTIAPRGKLSPPPRLGLRFQSRLALVLGLAGSQTIAPEKNWILVRVRLWVKISFGVEEAIFLGGNCPGTYRNTWLGNTNYNFCYSANMLNIRSRGSDRAQQWIAWYNMLIKFSKQVVNTFNS